MSARTFLCIDSSERSLRAIVVSVDGERATVERALAAQVPGEVDGNDTEAIARWIAETLRASAFPGGGAIAETIVTLDREQATVRRLELPTDDPDELPDMARLAMQRETPIESGSLAVDIIPREIGATATTVLIAAAPESVVARARRIGEVVGHGSVVVGLRAFGVARLLRDARPQPAAGSSESSGAIAAFDSSGDTLELIVARGGEIIYSRGVRVADAAGAASEAKRSWMGYRFSQSDEALAAAFLFAPEARRAEFSASLDRALGTPLAPFTAGGSLRVAEGVDRDALGVAWPLAGLVLERVGDEETINLAAPRRAPDLAARRRLRLLAGVGVLVIAALVGWTVGNLSRARYKSEVEELTVDATAKLPSHFRFKRDAMKIEHLRAWSGAQPDWLEESRFIHQFAPDSTKVVLDSLSATLEASDVQYDRSKRWKIVADLKVALTGEAKDRATADALRDALVENGRYTVTSTGADTEGGRRLASPFTYVLRGAVSKATADERAKPSGQPAAAPAGAQAP